MDLAQAGTWNQRRVGTGGRSAGWAKILELYWLGCVVGTNERKLGKAGSHSRSSFSPPWETQQGF